MTDRFDEWKFPETFDEDTADTFLKFADTFDEDSGDYAVFPWQFPQTFETGLESVSAVQPAVNAATNTADALFLAEVTASQPSAVAFSNDGSITAASVATTTVSTVASTNVADSTDLITATQPSAVADSNVGSLSSYNLSALSASVGASMNGIEAEATFFIKADVKPVSASQNDATLTSLTVGAIQPTTIGTTLSPELDFDNEIDAVLVSVSATENSTETYFTAEYDASQLQVGVTPNDAVGQPLFYIDAIHFSANSNASAARIRFIRYANFGNVTSSTLNNSQNKSNIRANVNEVN